MGASGKMGARLVALATETPGLAVGAAVERAGHPSLGRDAGEASGAGPLGVAIGADVRAALSAGDVVIDFTTSAATLALLPQAVEAKIALVIGTTGLDAAGVEAIRSASSRIPIVFAPNMSLGMNVMFKVVADVARALGAGYDVEIVEAHHRQKKDAPSGTALALGRALADAAKHRLDEVAVYARHGDVGPRAAGEIGIQTIRAGDIVGDHTVLFGGLGERLEITHRASSRDTFARGALRAAQWLSDKSPGLYDMQDVLGLK
ncbi:MAG: 4-hydroxy-tetrahydrodipicolinate reductase [Nitrospirae bacterium RIFCSPHIGHO2_01_FULL_66_17]|nr:MAG: 4-hydroxy-tetrahydrodipicolinate reductase [Nitrospirae bacterium RIFCSPHIGHO2_01_FULL_66_17]